MTSTGGLIDRYLFKECLRLFAGLCGLVLAILLIERLVRIVELVANSENGGVASFRMVIDLIPHYLQLAIPAALFLGMIIAIDRLSRSGELVTMLSAGLSLQRLSRPFFVLAALAAIVSLFISGFLQPMGRYDFRQTVHSIETQSFKAAFQEGRFVRFDNYTVWTDFRDFSGQTLGETFILEARPDGSERFMSAPSGKLLETGAGTFALQLEQGRGATLEAERDEANSSRDNLQFQTMIWPVTSEQAAFRPRGNDERELTLFELGDVSAYPGVRQDAATASLHDQLGRAALILILPLLAFPLGVNLGRKPRAGGIVFGIVTLLIVQKALEYGFQMAETGAVSGWAGTWPVVFLTAVAGIYFFSSTAGEPLLRWRRSGAVRNEGLVLSSGEQGK
ncbi:LptF/LptG family permease [Henriciella aquimarina]|uniref:LptF/LptG family permease n=1 Tax=Henriciella aquimarina TaxID=545261 RepID=UPI001301EBAA|nr:LptF/LptG family permease [Henriciella aquimarina]